MHSKTVREILISFSIFVSFLLVALASQLISPTTAIAKSIDSISTLQGTSLESAEISNNLFELDPEDPNPTLFAMASNKTITNDSILGGAIESGPTKITSTGLSITDLVLGEGKEAKSGQRVSVNYRGSLENGQEFDSSYDRGPFNFPLGAGQVIKGWDEGVEGMRVGGKRKLIIPPDLGYGSRGAGRVIPPNATLVFTVELIEVD